MKRLALLMAVVLICSSVVIAAEGDSPRSPQKQMQKIRNAQKELEQQRDELNQEREELEHQREQMQRHKGQRPPRDHMRKDGPKPICGLLMVMCLVVHILVAVWVFQDIRARGTGSGLWIVIALIAGLLGALVYAVVRLGDIKKS